MLRFLCLNQNHAIIYIIYLIKQMHAQKDGFQKYKIKYISKI